MRTLGAAPITDEHPRAAARIDDRVDLAVAAALRDPDRLISPLMDGPPLLRDSC